MVAVFCGGLLDVTQEASEARRARILDQLLSEDANLPCP